MRRLSGKSLLSRQPLFRPRNYPVKIRSPKTSPSEPRLLEEAFSLVTGGIGVQRALVCALLGERPLTPSLIQILLKGHTNNLLLSPLLFSDVYFQARAQVFSERREALHSAFATLDRKILRSALKGEWVDQGEDFSRDELTAMTVILLPGKPERETIVDELFEKRSSILRMAGVFLQNGIDNAVFKQMLSEPPAQYLPSEDLRPQVLALHTQKLELMADIFAADMEISGADPQIRPDWAQRWKQDLGEDMPTATILIQAARETIQRSRQK